MTADQGNVSMNKSRAEFSSLNRNAAEIYREVDMCGTHRATATEVRDARVG